MLVVVAVVVAVVVGFPHGKPTFGGQSPPASPVPSKPALKSSKTAESAVVENAEGSVLQKPSKEKPLPPINRPQSPPKDVEGKVIVEAIAEDTDGPAPALRPVPPPHPPGEDVDRNEDAPGGASKWGGLRCAVQMTRKRVAGLFVHPRPGGTGVVNPLKVDSNISRLEHKIAILVGRALRKFKMP